MAVVMHRCTRALCSSKVAWGGYNGKLGYGDNGSFVNFEHDHVILIGVNPFLFESASAAVCVLCTVTVYKLCL